MAEKENTPEDLKDRDHKKLGRELDLFTFSDSVGKGLPLWTARGNAIRRELERVIVDEEYMLRPMTCPHHFELYLDKPHSYRELPIRIAELANLYRYEQSGELMGLLRARTFCLADAPIICASEEQAAEEGSKALDLIVYVARVFRVE